MAVPFKEDFFERIINVSWETEPKVYWMACTGFPLIVNSIIGDDGRAWVFRSEDGIHWNGYYTGYGSGIGRYGFGAGYGGGWMRSNLVSGGQPVWVFVGCNGKLTTGSAAAYSLDGSALSGMQEMSYHHSCDTFIQTTFQTEPAVRTLSQFNFPNWHYDLWFSFDGITWKPQYDGTHNPGTPPAMFETRSLLAAQAALASPSTLDVAVAPSFSRAVIINDPNPQSQVDAFYRSLNEPENLPYVEATDAPEVTPFAQVNPKDIVFNGNKIIAEGKVKKGDFSGKKLTIRLSTWSNPSGGGAHGGPELEISVEGVKQKFKGNCGIARTECINYGHYVFVVGGSTGMQKVPTGSQAQKTSLAYSEDGFQWKVIELGLHSQLNVLAVGPRE